MKKRIQMSVDMSHGTVGLLPGLPAAAQWDCDVLQALLVVGYLTTPPRYRGISLSTYWAWLRYGAAISTRRSSLRLRPIWNELDPHQKTILSDDFGLGFPCHYLVEQHGFEDFADTAYLLDSLLAGVVSHASRSKRGPSKTPDLIGVDSLGRLHVLECKGSQTSRAALDDALGRGIAQKSNLSNGSIFASCMVGGIFVPQDRSAEEAQLVFIDPDPDPALKRLQALDPKVIERAVRRQSFAKALGTAGLWAAAGGVASGRVGPAEADFVRDLESGELRFNNFDKTEEETWRKTIEYRSLETDLKDEADRVAYVTRLVIDIPDDVVRRVGSLVGQTGAVGFEDLDAWLAERLVRERTVNIRTLASRTTADGKLIARRRSVTSAWTMSSAEGEFETASISVSSGIRFRIERQRFA
ncbi:hypothetical protein [Ottowia sp.]|uniref:hypothetical protein n=1 Tax=Ottowia sp. TaxID=1898956 RepID=UPI0025D9F9B5|nr:hypothetical protein [Ottowia sp.]MBK6747909.1 hypothetical protein [Ottowia sp.]